jgi:hypothetical protein
MIKYFVFALALCASTQAYCQVSGCPQGVYVPTPTNCPGFTFRGESVADAIREQTESQSRDAYLARQQMEYQQEETSRLTGAIQSQTMLGYPRY